MTTERLRNVPKGKDRGKYHWLAQTGLKFDLVAVPRRQDYTYLESNNTSCHCWNMLTSSVLLLLEGAVKAGTRLYFEKMHNEMRRENEVSCLGTILRGRLFPSEANSKRFSVRSADQLVEWRMHLPFYILHHAEACHVLLQKLKAMGVAAEQPMSITLLAVSCFVKELCPGGLIRSFPHGEESYCWRELRCLSGGLDGS